MFNHDEIVEKAWALYRSPEKEKIADYTKYDALYDVVTELGLHDKMSDDEYDQLMEEMHST